MGQIILPTYVCKLPSTGEQIKFRPFTVKEEKSLLLAIEENDIMTIAETLKNTISACTNNKIDAETAPYYDIEYLFLQIRAKSVGELIDLIGTCSCEKKTQFEVDISDTVVEPQPAGPLKLKIADTNYTIVMRHPSLIEYAIAFETKTSGSATVAKCIQTIYTDEEVFDWSYEEKLEFVESMSPRQQKEIIKFLDNMPTVKLNASFKCNCGKTNEKILSGFTNFFV